MAPRHQNTPSSSNCLAAFLLGLSERFGKVLVLSKKKSGHPDNRFEPISVYTNRNPNEPVKIIPLFGHEKALIQKASKGDREAQKAIYEQLAPSMLAVCRCYVKDWHYSEDVMIEAFVKAFRRLPEFRFEGSFEGWIRRIMVREAIDFVRKRQFVVYDEEKLEDATPPQQVSDPFQMEALEQLIEALPEGYRLVFTLYAVEGYKHAEIAELLDISENTSKSQLYKARRQLREQLKESSLRQYGTH